MRMVLEYERRARDAERMAIRAASEEERKAQQEVARIWRELAVKRRFAISAPSGQAH